jgi:DNA adenine methylase
MNSTNKIPKAPLKWAGGKARLAVPLRERIQLFKDKNRFVDLFCGAGTASIIASDFFENIMMNDLNEELINLYQVISTNPNDLINELHLHREHHSKEHYYHIRALDQTESSNHNDNVVRAARTIYLNKTGYNGLYRVNSKGYFNVPYGNPLFKVDEDNIQLLSKLLKEKKVEFFNLDYQKLLRKIKKSDLVYIDPPYDQLENDTFNGYTKEGFTRDDQKKLKLFIDKLTQQGTGVIYSNHATDFIKELFSTYIDSGDIYPVQRAISASGTHRRKVDEILITNLRLIDNEK